MVKQLAAVDAIHYAVAFGDLARARESADWLARNAMITPVPQSWAPHVSAVKRSAEKVASSKKLGDIGAAMGELLAGCGTCHQSLGLALVASSDVATPREARNKAMLSHTFAMMELEHGLLLPSEALWDQGAAMIEGGSFEVGIDPPTALDAREADSITAELIGLGSDAASAKSLEAKGSLYGKMMERCQGCHDLTRLDESGSK